MSSYAAEFLRQFVDGRPWVHMDIAGPAWGLTRNYTGKGASGIGTRTLIELARRAAPDSAVRGVDRVPPPGGRPLVSTDS